MDVMSTNGSNCGNASNPYHQCTQACFQKTKGNKPQSNRKTISTYGRSFTDGDMGKKVTNGERRTYPGCPKASNPYHTCDANCNNKSSSNSGATPHSKIDHRKKVGSKPEPPILQSVPTKKNGTTNNLSNSNASSTKPHYSENKKIESKTDEIIPSSGPISAQSHISDVMAKDQVKDSVIQDKVVASDEIVPITTHSVETGSKDFSFSDTPLTLNNNNNNKEVDSSSDGETDSVISESRIQIGKYNVKESFGSILQTILDKYGDIGASCDLESVVIRSYYMECVCFVVQELQSSSDLLTKSKVNELLDIVKDIESAHLRVAWLRNTLDEIAENIELIGQHQDMEIEKANYDREMESLREKLESELVTLAQKEQEIADIHMRIPEIRDRLRSLEQLISSGLEDEQTMLPIKSKIDQLL
ncbi:uncharacterized protein LOC131655028 [Vicia villosa]|uniref:uncharacterized protein LOC131655028 n=1 Tax=Vicia villosa TaxID=3911 RepID=UPI00273C5C8F|nr:uncharacterized protein LOC131655028 [Vicia villosa]